ncbi:PH domain-containing protein [Salinibacterium sp. NK8237]|uniref:PH domain-containing protein n=1 Tax=Salinibacterium sp. NK8237 TaxID=2792038 RepID=UPI0018CD94CF|nr:PH domain-containing protein [Salinibacterium sp. NK8237]MBH0130065.1 PH domain-containing protein [Salinibacterium sp. NK8237]
MSEPREPLEPGEPGVPLEPGEPLDPVELNVPESARRLADGEWHRLHPATPFLRGGIAFVAIIGVVIVNARDIFIDTIFGGGSRELRFFERFAESSLILLAILAVIVILLLSVGGFYLSWRMHTFRITDELVEVRSGVLFRTNRRGRLDRIQGINISRPFLARLFGAAKLEVNVAGQDANVELAYLRSAGADDLRVAILQLASGTRAAEAAAAAESGTQTGVTGLVGSRVNEFLAPELDPNAAPPESIVRISIPRLIGSLVLSEATIIAILAGIGIITTIIVTGDYGWIFALLPGLLGLGGYLASRLTRSLRYSIASTDDGIRVGYGLLSTTNETLPPGRIHAVEVSQPLLWRPAGWWEIKINTASQAASSSGATAKTTLLPVGDMADVHRVLQLILPSLADAKSRELLECGLAAGAHDDEYVTSPKRAAWLRWFSWRRNGFVLISDAVALRKGAIWRSLILVPQARMQSVSMHEGPLLRRMGLAELRIHTVAGPISATIGALDRADVVRFFDEVEHAAVHAAGVDTSHRWRSAGARTESPTPTTPEEQA